MDIYREEILDHFKNPRNYGEVKQATHKGMDRNASCGDLLEMSAIIEKGKVKIVKFKGEGCAVAMAAASMLTEKIKGMSITEIAKMTEAEIVKMLGINISSARMKCATLGLVLCKKLIAK
ncbi:MAG: iron-sulfur cluster assembly scaffold protein [Patescibacteria group bacterium]|nr:iron-sulfur cluster assembly scaffold protein [Patescibacteria group bacterium]